MNPYEHKVVLLGNVTVCIITGYKWNFIDSIFIFMCDRHILYL